MVFVRRNNFAARLRGAERAQARISGETTFSPEMLQEIQGISCYMVLEKADKPGFVPVRTRVTVIPLGQQLLAGSSNLPGSVSRADPLPYLVLLQTGHA